ncbi:amidase family protein [Desertibacillus haloalkaliphilus]|uniref:amidase family protein n=1 Tax=Desertibacillus haloalkaliphilus TaxID=1328930 RepID=UPI001C25DC10|nr:amidase family protein [Desertibacillus haloalkaliphilus]MBU8906504.1 S-layer homology domain-containing protein [Desertibacillus haloalkaliphilus]
MKQKKLIKRVMYLVLTSIIGLTGVLSFGSASFASEGLKIEEITANELLSGYEDGQYSTEEIIQAYLDRIETYEGTYNAFTFMNHEALEDAKEIDRLREEGAELGPLAGIPVVIKEAVDVSGFPTTFGWAPLSEEAGGIELMPTNDAPVVTRLKEAGAIIIGKTNIPAFSATGTHASTSWDGPTYNAFNPTAAPGGSSSGTAMAVSGNFAVMGVAEETGGSIQNPAAAQGVVGIKPSFGLVPITGVTPLAGSTRDVLGPHARTVEDAALMLDVMAGYTEVDPLTEAAIGNVPSNGYLSALDDSALDGKRIGLFGAGWRDVELTEETAELYNLAIQQLESQGAEVVDDPFAGSEFANYVEEAGNVGYESFFYDLANYLKNLDPDNDALTIDDVFAEAGEIPWTEDGPLSWLVGRVDIDEALSNPEVEVDLTHFNEVRNEYLRIINEVMDEHKLDAFVFPQMYKETPELGGENIGATTVSEINISGLPLITVPAGYYESGSPFALAFFGEMWSEADLIAMAYDYEQATGHRKSPTLIESPVTFTDLQPNHPDYEVVMDLVATGIINGYELADGTKEFRSDEKITRSQAAQMFTSGLQLDVPENLEGALENYNDIHANHSFAKAIAATTEAGLFKGNGAVFMTDQFLTREQLASVLVRAFGIAPVAESSLEMGYLADVSPAHSEDVVTLVEQGIFEKSEEFKAKETVSRVEFAKSLYNAMN